MISSIYIKNFVLIEEVKIDINGNFTAITGDTGSGKSLLLDAISFCFGSKFKTDIIRQGQSKALVSIELSKFYDQFLLEKFIEYNLHIENDDNLIISATIDLQGKKRYTINNQSVTQKAILSISENLLSFYGQMSFGDLLDENKHTEILDQFGKLDSLRNEVSKLYKDWYSYNNQYNELLKKEENILIELDYLSHAISELSAAKIYPDEENQLIDKRIEIQNNIKNFTNIKEAYEIYSNGKIADQFFKSHKILTKTSHNGQISENIQNILNLIDNAEIIVGEIENNISNLLKEHPSEFELETLEDRLFFIKSLARKYNIPSNEIEQLLEKFGNEYEKLSNYNNDKSDLAEKLLNSENSYKNLAKKLSEERKKTAKNLEIIVKNELNFLQMKGFQPRVEMKNLDKFSPHGFEKISFLASSNPGMPFDNIQKIASGGELSRFMLALLVSINLQDNKNNDQNNIPTIIFDEIDTGIGGAVADAVGERLKLLSKKIQIMAITHQPQVASKSDCHILVNKVQSDSNTFSKARILNNEDKVKEIARMLSGKLITENSTKAAEDLINI